MFTGIIQAVGTVRALDTSPRLHAGGVRAHRLEVDVGPLADGLLPGASVCVNGACLTVTELRGTTAGFDVVPETWRRSTLQHLRPGHRVHLERSLRAGDALDGHFVQGHVDGTGTIERIERPGGEWKVWVATSAELMPYIVPKGSIALDGTSLTVVDVQGTRFSVALVPTTLARTTFAERGAGSPVNIETDILARLVVARLAAVASDRAGGLNLETLRAAGFSP